MDFTIDTDSKTIEPQLLVLDFNDAELSKCITSLLDKIIFPEPSVKRYTAHTFRFKAEK